MKAINRILLGAAIFLGAATFASCSSDNDRMIGKWETATPTTVFPTIPGTVSSTATTTIEFSKGTDSKSGPVKLTTIYEMTLPSDSTAMAPVSTVNASINGTWTRDDKDDDDFFLSFDQNSLSVNAISAPELGPVTQVFLSSLARYTRIDDVEVNKANTVLTFEDTADSSYVLSRIPE